jgi:hypothetical protein
MKLWQLKNPQTGENIGGLQPLPENWGPIFGMEGVKDRLGDLSWLGITDRCWVEVEADDPVNPVKQDIDDRIAIFYEEANQKLANQTLTKGQWQSWIDYQQKLQNVPLQPGYPNEVRWPDKPE